MESTATGVPPVASSAAASVAAGTIAGASTSTPQAASAFPSALDAEAARHSEDMMAFLEAMNDYTPTIPDDVARHFLTRSGFVCDDARVRRIVCLATEKFVYEAANDAMQYCKIRMQGMSAKDRKDKKLVLTLEDLTTSLEDEYGIRISKPPYFADVPADPPKPVVAATPASGSASQRSGDGTTSSTSGAAVGAKSGDASATAAASGSSSSSSSKKKSSKSKSKSRKKSDKDGDKEKKKKDGDSDKKLTGKKRKRS